MRSHLLEGTVRHRRSQTTSYALAHGVYSFALDLDEIDEVVRRIPLIRRNRRGLVAFHDADHLSEPAEDLPSAIRAHLRAAGFAADSWRITLVATLRVMGYVFNPASFYLCRDERGALRVVIVEVHNTYGERHLYTLTPEAKEADGGAAGFGAGMEKDFYVSPFISIDGRYQVTVRDAPNQLSVGINLRQDGELVIATSLVLRRRPLTTRRLLWMLLRYPLIGHRTIGLIHWHALRLWRRGVRVHPHGDVHRRGAPGGVASAQEGRP